MVTCDICGHRERGGPFVWVSNHKFIDKGDIWRWHFCTMLPVASKYTMSYLRHSNKNLSVFQLYSITVSGWRPMFWITRSSSSSSSFSCIICRLVASFLCCLTLSFWLHEIVFMTPVAGTWSLHPDATTVSFNLPILSRKTLLGSFVERVLANVCLSLALTGCLLIWSSQWQTKPPENVTWALKDDLSWTVIRTSTGQ